MRVKSSTVTKSRHKKVLAEVKGHRLSRSRHYKVAHEDMLHARQYAHISRKLKKRDFRRLWIQRINAGLSQIDKAPSYSVFVSLLKSKQIGIDRKMLAHLAANEFTLFQAIVTKVYDK
jgi:large subunit ribosomal protein L20